MMRTGFSLMLALVVVLGWPGSLRAQSATSELRVATFVTPPFVIKNGDQLTGFGIDLWEAIAARLNIKSKYQICVEVAPCLELLRSNKADIGVSAVVYSAERDEVLDFTYPILNSGFRVMVRAQDEGKARRLQPLGDWYSLMFSPLAAAWLISALLIIIVPAHIIWVFEHRKESDVTQNTNYFPGIFHSMLWAFTALVSQVQALPKQWVARIFAPIWMFAGVVFVALYTAQLTALLTVAEIRGAINGPNDLPGKRVGTVAGTQAATYLRTIKAEVQESTSLGEMYQTLLEGKVDAVFFPTPALEYYAAHEGLGKVKLVGPEINRGDMGFVVPLGSPLRKRVSTELLKLHEDGTYERIHARWFGNE